MSPSPADLAIIDAFEKIRAYLLERDPSLESGALERPADESAWLRHHASEYHEALLAVLLGIDRHAPAGRRAARNHLRTVRELEARDERWRVSEKGRDGGADLFQREAREKWVRENLDAILKELEQFSPTDGNGPPAVLKEVADSSTRRDAVTTLRRRVPLLRGRRAMEFLAEIGYSIVIPDPARRRLFHRLGWTDVDESRKAFPQVFFETCDRVVHLTGEPAAVINAATGLFAGARDCRGASKASCTICAARPRCSRCIVRGHCAYYRYRGEPESAPSRSVKNMAVAEQPRTRFEMAGATNLSEAELLALVIRTGAEGKSSLDLAREILERFGTLESIARAGLGELCEIKGVGRAKAIEVQAALELGRRLTGGPVPVGQAIRRSADVFDLYRGMLAHEEQENFYLLVLNTRNRIQKHFLISRGSLTGSQVHPREVAKAAVREAASAVIFLHNHPSGDPEPSEDDRDVTNRLAQATRLLGIRVLDHVIIGRDNFFSFADHGLL